MAPSVGEFVRVRSRRWLVESGAMDAKFPIVRLACIDDDAAGEMVEVLWDAELDAEVLRDEGWSQIAKQGTDDPSTFSAYLKTLRWNTATSSDRELFQAPFRAGIHLDAFQLLPLRKALRLPRVNLLIADDVGAGKTIEAALVLRELLLRHRIDFVLVTAPAGTVRQWQDELETKFGLSFTIVDREHLNVLRRERGYGAEPCPTRSMRRAVAQETSSSKRVLNDTCFQALYSSSWFSIFPITPSQLSGPNRSRRGISPVPTRSIRIFAILRGSLGASTPVSFSSISMTA